MTPGCPSFDSCPPPLLRSFSHAILYRMVLFYAVLISAYVAAGALAPYFRGSSPREAREMGENIDLHHHDDDDDNGVRAQEATLTVFETSKYTGYRLDQPFWSPAGLKERCRHRDDDDDDDDDDHDDDHDNGEQRHAVRLLRCTTTVEPAVLYCTLNAHKRALGSIFIAAYVQYWIWLLDL